MQTKRTTTAGPAEKNSPFRAHRHPTTLKSCLSVPILTDLTEESATTTDDENNSSKSNNNNTSTKSLTRNVSFCHIEIREYEQTLVDNPSVSCGPALGLDWTYNPKSLVFDVNDYEFRMKSMSLRRSKEEMIMPKFYREIKLQREWNITKKEINDMNKKVQKVRRQRMASIANPHAVEVTFDAMRNAKRKLKRMMMLGGRRRGRSNSLEISNYDNNNNSTIPSEEGMASKRCLSMNDMNLYESVAADNDVKKTQSCHDMLILGQKFDDFSLEDEEEEEEENNNENKDDDDNNAMIMRHQQQQQQQLKSNNNSTSLQSSSSSNTITTTTNNNHASIMSENTIVNTTTTNCDDNKPSEKKNDKADENEDDDWGFGFDDDDENGEQERKLSPGYF